MPRRYDGRGRSRVRRVYLRASHRRHHAKFPILPAVGLLAGVYTQASQQTKGFTDYGPGYQNLMNGLSLSLIGRDMIENKWNLWPAVDTYAMTLAGYIGHKFLNWTGINRKMPDAIAL